MAKKQSKTGLIVSIVVLVLTIAVVGAIVYGQRPNNDTSNTSSSNTDSNDDNNTNNPDGDSGSGTPAPSIPDQDGDTNIDVSKFAFIDVEPLEIRVAYENVIPSFEFFIKRTSIGTRYVEFTYDKLIGDKCTNDEGVFMSIIENPSTPEDLSTISKTTVVDGTTYGMTLESDTCTNDKALLSKYQNAFSDGFTLLEAMD